MTQYLASGIRDPFAFIVDVRMVLGSEGLASIRGRTLTLVFGLGAISCWQLAHMFSAVTIA